MALKENLKRLISPRSIVFVGGRDLVAVAVRNCEELGYEGEIRVVNPKYKEIAGHTCYSSIAELPEVPDAAFVGVRRELTVEVVRELSALGAGGCVCYAAGFAELDAGGGALQEELVEAAGEMALVGPNCYGMLNCLDGAALWPDDHGGSRVERGVAIISQSGNISWNLTMADRSVPLSYVFSIGNQASLGLADYVDALVEDPRVTAIGMYVEGIKDVPGFSRAASRALEKGVPLVALKPGSSELGNHITLSHTSSLSGQDDLYDALFKRLGVVRVDSVPSLLETLKLLSVHGPLPGPRLGVLSVSGGDAALFADLADSAGLEIPGLSETQEATLREQLASFTSIGNPLDYNTAVWGDRGRLEWCFSTLMGGSFDAAVLLLHYPRPGSGDTTSYDMAVDALIASQEQTGTPGVVACTLTELLPADARRRLLAGGVVPLQGLHETAVALRGASWYGERRNELLGGGAVESFVPLHTGADVGESRLLDEWESKRLLSGFGVETPKGQLVSAEEASEVAGALGFPVVVKAVSSTIAHKSELGAVELNLKTVEEVAAAAARIGANVSGEVGASSKLLVERMVEGTVAELIVGLKKDERFGLALVIGAGGVLVNFVEDSATLLLPTSRKEVDRALGSLKVSGLIEGFRGGPRGDREAAVDAILAVAAFAEEYQDDIEELDVNPLLVLPEGEGAVAADVLVRLDGERKQQPPDSGLNVVGNPEH